MATSTRYKGEGNKEIFRNNDQIQIDEDTSDKNKITKIPCEKSAVGTKPPPLAPATKHDDVNELCDA